MLFLPILFLLLPIFPALLYYTLPAVPVQPQNTYLSHGQVIQSSPAPVHPETAFTSISGNTCTIFTTDARGFLWTLSGDLSSYNLHSTPGGTLLGGAVHASSNSIYVCDATRGLLRIPSAGGPAEIVSAFVTHDPAERVSYCNDVSVPAGGDGRVYFTSATRLHPAHPVHAAFASTLATYITDTLLRTRSGRVLAYDPSRGTTAVIADGFAFANGIAAHPSGEYAVVAETGTRRLWKVALRGEQCGKRVLLRVMPGLPDGVSYDPVEELFWVALFTPVPAVARIVETLPLWVRMGLAMLPTKVFALRTTAMVLGVKENGELKWVLGDGEGRLGSVSAAHRCGEFLWLGNLTGQAVARVRLGDVAGGRVA